MKLHKKHPHKKREKTPTAIEYFITWIGSEASLVAHTFFFIAFFALAIFGYLSWNLMLLAMTTLVSLEAIYLAIFIQMTVNKHSESLREVEHDLEEIEEDIDEIQEDFEDMSEEEKRDAEYRNSQAAALNGITTDIHRILADLEEMKKGK